MILVTGGTGLVGSHLLLALCQKGVKVRAIFRSESSQSKTRAVFEAYDSAHLFENIDWFAADLLDYFSLEKALEGVDWVYHAAAKVSFAAKDEADLMRSNIDGTAHLVNLALEKNIKKFAYVSSVAALGSYADGRPSDEETIWQLNRNTSAYSVSKYYAENEVWRGSAEGLNVMIVNPSTILGFGEWTESSSTLIKKVNDGLRYYPAGGNGFVGVKDVVRALILGMESDVKNERFVLVAENLAFQTLFEKIAQALGKKAPSIAIPKKLAYLGVFYDFIRSKLLGKAQVLTFQSIDTAYRQKKYSAEKFRRQFDFDFESIDLVLKKTCALYNYKV